MIRFIGTKRGIEGKVLPHEGFTLDYISALPLMGLVFANGWPRC